MVRQHDDRADGGYHGHRSGAVRIGDDRRRELRAGVLQGYDAAADADFRLLPDHGDDRRYPDVRRAAGPEQGRRRAERHDANARHVSQRIPQDQEPRHVRRDLGDILKIYLAIKI